MGFYSITYDLSVVKYNCKTNLKVKYWVEDYVLFGVIKTAAVFCNINNRGRSKTVYSVQRTKTPKEVMYPNSRF